MSLAKDFLPWHCQSFPWMKFIAGVLGVFGTRLIGDE